jgi:hypothetical protein
VTPFPAGGGLCDGLGVGLGVGLGDGLAGGLGLADVVLGVGAGPGQLAAEPFVAFTAALKSVVPGSRSYNENIMVPPRPLQCR